MKNFLLAFIAILFLSLVLDATADPIIVDGQTGKYLGNLNSNQFDPNSTSNKFGRYGSKFSPDSIQNEFGKYGSRFSNDSGNNPYSTNSPVIIDHDD